MTNKDEDEDVVDAAPPLSELGARVLAFEARWPRNSRRKAVRMNAELAMTEARYHQLLNVALDAADADAFDAALVLRLRARREARRAARCAPDR